MNDEEWLGMNRVRDARRVLPQVAERLDASPACGPTEIVVDVEELHIDAASMRQLADANDGDASRVARAVHAIVAERGKMHNPITGSGGVFLGTVREVGSSRPDAPRVGTRIVGLVSLTLVPLRLRAIRHVDLDHARIRVEGTAVLAGSSAFCEVPSDLPEPLVLAALDVCGAPALAKKQVLEGERIAVFGAGRAGLLVAHVAACANASVHVLDVDESALNRVKWAVPNATMVAVDARDAIAVRARVGVGFDRTFVCVDCAGAEAAAVLVTRATGSIVFFGMATSFSSAALVAEGLGSEVHMQIGNGFVPGHAEDVLSTLRACPDLRAALEDASGVRVDSPADTPLARWTIGAPHPFEPLTVALRPGGGTALVLATVRSIVPNGLEVSVIGDVAVGGSLLGATCALEGTNVEFRVARIDGPRLELRVSYEPFAFLDWLAFAWSARNPRLTSTRNVDAEILAAATSSGLFAPRFVETQQEKFRSEMARCQDEAAFVSGLRAIARDDAGHITASWQLTPTVLDTWLGSDAFRTDRARKGEGLRTTQEAWVSCIDALEALGRRAARTTITFADGHPVWTPRLARVADAGVRALDGVFRTDYFRTADLPPQTGAPSLSLRSVDETIAVSRLDATSDAARLAFGLQTALGSRADPGWPASAVPTRWWLLEHPRGEALVRAQSWPLSSSLNRTLDCVWITSLDARCSSLGLGGSQLREIDEATRAAGFDPPGLLVLRAAGDPPPAQVTKQLKWLVLTPNGLRTFLAS